jgi:hypothetical protein
MADYRRCYVPDGSFFFTVVTEWRAPILGNDWARDLLRRAFRIGEVFSKQTTKTLKKIIDIYEKTVSRIVSPQGKLDDGRKVTAELVHGLIPEELAKVKATVTAQGEDTATYDQAAGTFDKMSVTPDYPEFLTLPLYEAMD